MAHIFYKYSTNSKISRKSKINARRVNLIFNIERSEHWLKVNYSNVLNKPEPDDRMVQLNAGKQ